MCGRPAAASHGCSRSPTRASSPNPNPSLSPSPSPSPNPPPNPNIQAAHACLEPELIADTVVLITTCQGMPEIFDEKAPPPLQRKRVLKGVKDEKHLRILRESNPLGLSA